MLARLARENAIDLPRRKRVAILSGRIARAGLTLPAALRLAADGPAFFAAVLDLRTAAPAAEAAPLDRALGNESLLLCLAARESLARTLATGLARFRAEAIPEVFAPIFDRLLLPKWRTESPQGASLLHLWDAANNWELRDFAAGAVAAHRFDALLSVAGEELTARLTRAVDRTADPLNEAMRLAEIIDATASPDLLERMRMVAEEFARCKNAGDLRGANLCIQRHFSYDDDDGVRSSSIGTLAKISLRRPVAPWPSRWT